MQYILVAFCVQIKAALLSEVEFIQNLPFITLNVGTPGQPISMLLDTGSYKSVIPCEQYGRNQQFYIEESSTSKLIKCANNITPQKCQDCSEDNKCIFNQVYADGTSIRGYFFEDQVEFGQIESLSAKTRYSIGCINKLYESPNGIMGMMGLIHTNQTFFPNIIDKVTDTRNQSFAICFNPSSAYMFIGLKNGQKSIPYYRGYNQYYTIKILHIQSDGFRFNHSYFQSVPIVLDSGSNQIVFGDKQVFDYFQSHFNQYVSKKVQVLTNIINEQCVYRNSRRQDYYNVFPTYRFQLENGVDFSLQPENYLIYENGAYCSPMSYMEGFPGIILGTPFMMGQELTFDQSTMQIHFTQNCSYDQMKQTLLIVKNTTETQVVDISNNETEKIDLDTPDDEDESHIDRYLMMVLIIFVALIILLISYQLRRIKLYSLLYIQDQTAVGTINTKFRSQILKQYINQIYDSQMKASLCYKHR